jgi:hypothetical protein
VLKVTINEIPVTLACSEAGKQALNTAEMTLRQRQFILLIKENTSLGEQASSNLLSKLDLQQLIEKGWISCDVPLGQIFKQPSTPVAALANAIASTDTPSAETVLSKKCCDRKTGAKNLQSFLNTYTNAKLAAPTIPDVSNIELPSLRAADTSQQHPMADSALALKIPEALQPKMGQVHEDIMILQSLIDD